MKWLVLSLFLFSSCLCEEKEEQPLVTDAKVFRKLFKQKRVEQLGAVQQLLTLNAEKQVSLLDTMMDKMKGVMLQSRARLESSGYATAADKDRDFPSDELTKNALAHIMENTCFLGDILLRFPDYMHDKFAGDAEWKALFAWGLGFATESGLADEATVKLMGLSAQEAGFKEKEENYHNPYRIERKKQKRFEDPPPPKKKEKKKLKKGPQLSRAEL